MEEGKFLGVIVTNGGFRANPEKVEAVLKMPSPKTIKQVQTLNGLLVALSRFLLSHAERSFPFVSTLRNCLKKSQSRWTVEAEATFQEIKSRLAELPILTVPNAKEPLVIYLAASVKAISAVVMVERGSVQTPIYYVSRTLANAETRYSTSEKMVQSLVQTARRLRRFENRQEVGGSTFGGARRFNVSGESNKGSYDAKDEKMASYLAQDNALMGTFITCKVKHVKLSENKQADALSKLASLSFEHLAKDVHVEVLTNPSTIVREVCNWAIGITWSFPEAPGRVNFLIVTIDYFTKWIEAKPMATINEASIKKFIWEFIIFHFGLPLNLVSDNGTQFTDQRIREWLKELNITQTFTSIANLQGNGEVECANRRIIGGIKRRLADYKSDWHRSNDSGRSRSAIAKSHISEGQRSRKEIRLNASEERREFTATHEQNYKRQLQKYYDARVKICEFNAGDYVLPNNEASKAQAQ
ncbi:uncharacterized protein LOC143624501 [Bidens hawaiensis]|uniref:uncharacterized protein LOC143624501 n=1 Tax=Bidens hawaiensis TaxID=980011 RepID=UPI00404A5999